MADVIRHLMQVAHRWADEPNDPEHGRSDTLEMELRKAFIAPEPGPLLMFSLEFINGFMVGESEEVRKHWKRIYAHAPGVQGVQPPYPSGIVTGPCVCGSWPGGECLRCEWRPSGVLAAPEPQPRMTKCPAHGGMCRCYCPMGQCAMKLSRLDGMGPDAVQEDVK